MKFHRVHFKTFQDSSQGFAWFARADTARKVAREFNAEHADKGPQAEAEAIEVPTDRAGLLTFLRNYASHPDNG